jgi:hypothetical protein
MSRRGQGSRLLEERLLAQPRRTAEIDSSRQPVRLGERDTTGHLVGYIDEHGVAWESLAEQIVARHRGRLFDALKLRPDDPRRDRLVEEALADVPDELIGEVARAAAEVLALRDLAQGFER